MIAPIARRLWTRYEAYHALVYFTEEARAALRDAGYRGFWMGYFAQRCAPLGAVPPAVATAVCFGFHPAMVARALPDAWHFAPPVAALDARLDGVDASLRRLGVVGAPELPEAAELARAAAEAIDLGGRPLAAGNAALPWPDEAHLALWHATTILREHRGDGHVCALVAAELDGCAANVLAAAAGTPRDVLQPSRGWGDDDWSSAARELRGRGWLDGSGGLTPDGAAARDAIEAVTDELAERPWVAIGEQAAARLLGLLDHLGDRIAGEIPFPNPIGLPVRD